MEDALLSRAFQVRDIPEDFDPSKPPSTGEEYLQHVMHEAMNCPQVVVADLSSIQKKNKLSNLIVQHIDEIDKCTEGSELAPSKEWQLYQVAKFSQLKLKVNRLRNNENFCPIELPTTANQEKWYEMLFEDKDTKILPSLSVLFSMKRQLLERILDYHVDWLEDGLSPEQARWIYAILACINLPLSPDVCSTLRNLARACAKLRSQKASTDDKDVRALNLIICLVSRYFGEMDLAD